MHTVSATQLAKKFAIHMGSRGDREVGAILERQNINGMTADQHDFASGSIGCLGNVLPDSAGGNLCFFTGSPINGPEASQITDAQSAQRLFPGWDGPFVGVFWDAQQKILVIATDCLGLQPLYMRRTKGELTLVSETKALAGAPDMAAWGAFISIGHPIGHRSLMQDLERVPPASILTYDCMQDTLDIRRYWEWPEPSAAWQNYDFLGALEQDIRGYNALESNSTLLLSGGFDSRLLLFLLQRANIPASALIVTHDDEHGDADGRLARAIAKRAGVAYGQARPSADFYSSAAYLDYLQASDVGFPSLGLFIAKVAEHVDCPAVWDGLVPGAVFMPLHQTRGGFQDYLRQEIRNDQHAIWQAARVIFRPEVASSMYAGFHDDLDVEKNNYSQDEYGLARFVIHNRSRNRPAINPVKVYAHNTQSFIPGASKDFMAHAATIPFSKKEQGRFYRTLFKQIDKRSLSVPFLSGGELLAGQDVGSAYYMERLRIRYHRFRTQHPSLFNIKAVAPLDRFNLLGAYLLEEDDPYLAPDIRERLSGDHARNYTAWRLLFHWKAWKWLHEGRLTQMLGRHVR